MKVCVSLTRPDNEMMERTLQEAEMLEFRLDLIGKSPKDLAPWLAAEVPAVVTCRPGKLPDEKRKKWLVGAMEAGADYVDIDLHKNDPAMKAHIIQAARSMDKKIIMSYHNFVETPTKRELQHIIKQGFQEKADIVKLATMVQHYHDNALLISLYADYENIIALGMGALGKITRVSALFSGAPFMYAAVDEANNAAPGQFSYRELMHLRSFFAR